MVKIIIDRHEKDSLIASELVENHYEIEFNVLPVADYLIGDVAIERKTVSDFISSMLNKRLLKQLRNLQQYQRRMLIIEGIDEKRLYEDCSTNGVHPNAIRGMLLSIMLDFSIPIILAKDYKDAAKFIMLIAKRFEKSKKEISLRVKRKALDMTEQQQMIIEGFPSIGPATAKTLLKKFRTIKAIINAPLKKMEKIKKVGKKAKIIKEIVEKKYNA